ncbi:Zinc finger, RING/FYVE/PHD-type [Sesbania bispinosa]|nr:Zinc finger, RING/FYVE/PHD-type [Sesbania bispinosa]
MANDRGKTCLQPQPEPDDWCFKCKDGGELVICDHEKCFAASQFTVVRGVKGLCSECLELVEIIEQNLDHDKAGMTDQVTVLHEFRAKIVKFILNKIILDDRDTEEGLFKEYWEIIKVKEGLTGDDVLARQPNYGKGKNFLLHRNCSEGEEEKQNDSMPWDSEEDNTCEHKPTKRKRYNSEEFVGWGSKPLISFLESIGKYEAEPMTQWGVRTIIYEYIKEKNLHHSSDKRKFLPDEKLYPIFRKKVMPKHQIYHKLEFHFAKKLDDSAGEKNDDQHKNRSSEKRLNDQTTCTESRFSDLIGKPLLKKGDLFIKSSCFASINDHNIKLIYLKRTLVQELSKEPGSFGSKIIGSFVRAKVVTNDPKQRWSYHLLRVIGVEYDGTSNKTLLQVSSMPQAIPISDLSNEDFTEQECEDLRQNVKSGLLLKLTVEELQEKAESLHEDITKHYCRHCARVYSISVCVYEKEELEQPWKQEQLLRHVPSVSPELIEAKYDDSDEDKLETDGQDQTKQLAEKIASLHIRKCVKRRGRWTEAVRCAARLGFASRGRVSQSPSSAVDYGLVAAGSCCRGRRWWR